jgi:DNA-binding transcriptional ArsR family regulator
MQIRTLLDPAVEQFHVHRSIQSLNIAETASLIADPSRAAMLVTLLDGRAYTAKELAWAADITAQTASFHLRKLTELNFILAVRQGRHRYFRLAGEEAAQTLEGLLAVRDSPSPRGVPSSCPKHLRVARYCYNHIAGQLGVEICRLFLRNDWIAPGERGWNSTSAAVPVFDMLAVRSRIAPLPARLCLDWSEREYHLAGELGNSLATAMLDRRWVLRGAGRALTLTSAGRRHLSSLGARA